MNGLEEITYKLVSVAFPSIVIHPDYNNTQALSPKEVQWKVGIDFKLANLSAEWFDIIITAVLSMVRNKDGAVISELVTVSKFSAPSKLSYAGKYTVVNAAVNNTFAYAQGAWTVKNSNIHVSTILPNGHDKVKDIEIQLKKLLYEHLE